MINFKLLPALKFITEIVDLSEEDLINLTSKMEFKKYKKGSFLIQVNELNDKFFFINKGIVRNLSFDFEGNELTYDFKIEGMLVSEHISFLNGSLASLSSQCLEDCEVIIVSKKVLDEFYLTSQQGEKLGRLISEKIILELLNDRIDLHTKTVSQRYIELTNKFPKIHQRIPQHFIASYLGITSVHLSRIKSKME
jgi:CRP-like cAMP-binding protein